MRTKAFILGIFEFRHDVTTSFLDLDLMEAYDTGREFAHRITFRKFER